MNRSSARRSVPPSSPATSSSSSIRPRSTSTSAAHDTPLPSQHEQLDIVNSFQITRWIHLLFKPFWLLVYAISRPMETPHDNMGASDRRQPIQVPFKGLKRTEVLRAKIGLRTDPQTNITWASGDPMNKEFFKMTDEETVELLRDAFLVEMESLQNAPPTMEVNTPETQGDPGKQNAQTQGEPVKETKQTQKPLGNLGKKHDQTPSQLMYKEDYEEVNRSMVGVLALKWVVNGNYVAFTQNQPVAGKLSEESFAALRKHVTTFLTTADRVYALLVATFANDLGKDEKMNENTKPYRAEESEVNHDEVIYLAAKNHLIEIIDEFLDNGPMYLALMRGLHLGAKLNVPQLAQAENVPGSLAAVKLLEGDEVAFELKYLEIIFDVAGAGGHIDAGGAKNMIDPTWGSFLKCRDVLQNIVKGTSTLRGGYDMVLQQRADLLALTGFRKLSVEKQHERGLLRLLTMGRVVDQTIACRFADAFDNLDEVVKHALSNGLAVDGVSDGCAIIPYYGPSLFANVMNATKPSGDLHLKALRAVLTFLARVYKGTEPRPDCQKGLIVECRLDFARKVITSDDFAINPKILAELPIPPGSYSVSEKHWSQMLRRGPNANKEEGQQITAQDKEQP